MTENKKTVTLYMEAFRSSDREAILSCLTDDVEWLIPGVFEVRGREAFGGHIIDEGFQGQPDITVIRMIEENDIVIAEGTVRAGRTDGTVMNLVFCDVFEMRDAKIRKLISYLMEVK
jgi:ketosteroid isomerase-like protein